VSAAVDELVRHFEGVRQTRMRELPLLNNRLTVDAVGFESMGVHEIGVLITPWFMNLVVLPGDDQWDELAQGSRCQVELPAGCMEFNVGGNESIGTFLTAVLFRAVTDFPDHETARDVAREVMSRLFTDPEQAAQQVAPRMSRRALFSRAGRN